MRLALPISAVVSLMISLPVAAIDCAKAVTTPDINACASAEQKKVEARLNDTYQRILRNLEPSATETASSSRIKATLVEAQRAWVKFREADCHALYTLYEDGTIRTVMYIGCMQTRAERRIKDLEEEYEERR
jgi:uncharacterized protein YecT (DUF1311 family)